MSLPEIYENTCFHCHVAASAKKRRGYKFRKVHAKIPPGRTQRTSTSTYGSLASLSLSLLSPSFFSSFRERKLRFNLPCTTCCAILTGGKRRRGATFSKCFLGRVKITSLISRSSLAINASRGGVFVAGGFHYSRSSLRQM